VEQYAQQCWAAGEEEEKKAMRQTGMLVQRGMKFDRAKHHFYKTAGVGGG
jgi:hypothetical protein